MKKWLLILVGCLFMLYGMARFIPIDPAEQRPGLRLDGTLGGNSEWQQLANSSRSFGSNLVQFETRPWYGLRHSVTTTSLTRDGEFYIPCGWCSKKRWPTFVANDPRVRLRVDGVLFERIAVRVNDEALLAEFAEGPSDLWLYRLDPPE